MIDAGLSRRQRKGEYAWTRTYFIQETAEGAATQGQTAGEDSEEA
jgi:hypothetical protein